MMWRRPWTWELRRQIVWVQALTVLAVIAVVLVVDGRDTWREAREAAAARAVGIAQAVAGAPVVAAAHQVGVPAADRGGGATAASGLAGDPASLAAADRYLAAVRERSGATSIRIVRGGTAAPDGVAVGTAEVSGGGSVEVAIPAPRLRDVVADRLRTMLGIACLVLGVAIAGNAMVSWRVRRHTYGLGTAEITRMFDYYQAVLHSAKEGMVLVDPQRRLQLANDEARRLLGGGRATPGQPVAELAIPPTIRELLGSGRAAVDELHLGAHGVVVVNQQTARWRDADRGTVTTFRDHTELQALTGELDAVRSLAGSLSSQAHEASNRLHTVVGLVEIGEAEKAVEFAVAELEFTQALTDRVVDAVDEPVLAALLLGKVAQAAERGVEFAVTGRTRVTGTGLGGRELVTIVGNLLDNALDAAASGPRPRRVELTASDHDGVLRIQVADSGAGLDGDAVDRAFERGWTTKSGGTHGLGLALVRQTVERLGGEVAVHRGVLTGGQPATVFTSSIPLPAGSTP